MKPEEQIEQALRLCERFRRIAVEEGVRDLGRERKGLQSELKKIFTYLVHYSAQETMKLVESLPESNFAGRTGSTPVYYRIIRAAMPKEFFDLPKDDSVRILGWVCRLL